jgi:hypothetical protein
MKNNKKKKYIIILFLLVLSLSVGFALLQTNLKINGSSKIQGSSWDIHFENLNVTNGSVALSTGDVGATIQSSRTDITYTVTLDLPGDYYEFTVDAVNAGSVDGMVESVTSKLNNQPITTLPSYLNYSVSYSDDKNIEINHLLKAGTSETYKVRIEFKKDIALSDLPSIEQNLTLNFGVVYVQADENGVDVGHLNGIIYTINKYDSNVTEPKNNSVWLHQAYPETIPYFETPAEALSAIAVASGKNLPFYLKHKVEKGIVTESYVEFVVTEAMAQANPGMVPGTYTLRGNITYDSVAAEYLVNENYISPYYDDNKEKMKTAFGYATNQSRCSETGTGRSSTFYCSVYNFRVNVTAYGGVTSGGIDSSRCTVYANGSAACIW